MLIEDLEFEDGDHGYFDEHGDFDCLMWAGLVEGGWQYGCAVNPNLDPDRELGVLGWCAQRVTRIEEYGFERAMEMDNWQLRGDGRWQSWGRMVYLPEVD